MPHSDILSGVILSGFRVVFRDLNPTKSGQVWGSVGAGWPKLETFIGSRVKSYRVGVQSLQVGGRWVVRGSVRVLSPADLVRVRG